MLPRHGVAFKRGATLLNRQTVPPPDVHVLPNEKTLRVSNDSVGIRKLKRWIVQFDPALVVVEATGKWHREVQRSLVASGIKVAVVDPYRVRMFAKAQGILAKTDRLDARVLALFGLLM